jgi:hypothetical protein
MLQRLLGQTTLIMTKRYCQAVECEDAIQGHKKFVSVDRIDLFPIVIPLPKLEFSPI